MEKLQQAISTFIEKRHWQQFHTPKNLAMALSVESAELLEIFQWMTPEESCQVDGEILDHIEEEIGDVLIYLTTLAKSLNLDPVQAARKKLEANEQRFPVDENFSKGN